jgi:hypothetical protein
MNDFDEQDMLEEDFYVELDELDEEAAEEIAELSAAVRAARFSGA